ncbi:N,N-dimethylformamidase beta subunit family domain-containing protein [Catellatospora sichuanensis]|uniref:N,N-dimethylformamidase beta subunit family domain-containing protein n=1 Tax=Catellatospora sichuanensis TaxID=1969805 RepID=UPI001C8FBFC1|nr:N,N-dimethylformamidase beta subunit family domain-containing protein [Catellatospora sichuanensis]
MPSVSRRAAIGGLAAGAAGVLAACGSGQKPQRTGANVPQQRTGESVTAPASPKPTPGRTRAPRTANPVPAENSHPTGKRWLADDPGFRSADDVQQQIAAYASATSVAAGESIDFHVHVGGSEAYRIEVFRLGHYGGAGARHVVSSPTLNGRPQPKAARVVKTNLVACDWPVGWTLKVPAGWVSGMYVAVFTTASNHRSHAVFVVRDERRTGNLCVVLPFSTYQAYNFWPRDGRLGRNLYHGYRLDGVIGTEERSRKVSFDRPYSGSGLPYMFDTDYDLIQWAERSGYDVTYATSVDLHAGRIDPLRHAGLVFPGHDEYWSAEMRAAAETAVAGGVSLAFLAANNVYWNIGYEPAGERPDRVVACYKYAQEDPGSAARRSTVTWRTLSAHDAEQRLLGVQYNGVVATAAPLIVQQAGHWMWQGAGVQDGMAIRNLVAGEADGRDAGYPFADGVQTLLSASPYTTTRGKPAVQNTSVYEAASGAVVFCAGTFNWPLALNRRGYRDPRIQRATTNLMNRMLNPEGAAPAMRA